MQSQNHMATMKSVRLIGKLYFIMLYPGPINNMCFRLTFINILKCFNVTRLPLFYTNKFNQQQSQPFENCTIQSQDVFVWISNDFDKMVVISPDFRSHSKFGPFATQPLLDHSKPKLVRISDPLCSNKVSLNKPHSKIQGIPLCKGITGSLLDFIKGEV